MSISQAGGLWRFIDLLSAEDSTLFKAADNPSTWDADSDLCLRSARLIPTDLVSFRFILPASVYEFIEIDAIALGTETNLTITALANYSESSAISGEYTKGNFLVTTRLRTYRLPFIGEVEAFTFQGFTSSSAINIKAIRFFTRSDTLQTVVAPEPEPPELITNVAHLEKSGAAQVRDVNDFYPIVIAPGGTANLSAIFVMDGVERSYGLIRLSLSTEFSGDISYSIADQTGLVQNFTSRSTQVDIFVTTEFQSITINATSPLSPVPTSDVTICVKLLFFESIPVTSAFGVPGGRVVSPLVGIQTCAGGGDGGGSGTIQADYVVMNYSADLSSERRLIAGTGVTITDNGPNNTVVISATGGGSGVSSVNTRTGAVVLTSADVGLSNVTNVAQVPLSYLDVDGTLAANSDTKVATQKATKTYVDAHTGSSGITALTGDVTASGTGSVPATLATVNANVGSFGSATKASTFTVNAKGLTTAAGEITVTPSILSVSGLATGVATFLGTPSSANLAAALTDETGTGAAVFATSPVLVTPNLGTPSTLVATNATGTAASLTAGIALALKSLTTTVDVSAASAPTAGQLLIATGSSAATWQSQTVVTSFTIDGGGSTITTGIKGDIEIPFAATITGVTLLADQSGSIVVDIWKDTYANFPPVVGDSITAAALPTISAALKYQDTTLTGWTTTVAAGDILRFNVNSATTVTRVLVSLKLRRT